MNIYDLKAEQRIQPLGIDQDKPRLSWKIENQKPNTIQTAYHIFAYQDAKEQELLWDGGKVISDQSVAVRWNGPKLVSGQRVYWKVQVETKGGKGESEHSESKLTWFEMGILQEEDWKAEWIEPEEEVEIDGRMPAAYLRKTFEVRHGLKSARIYQSAHGLYEFWINGAEGTKDRFKPGFTSYYHRLQYQAYDITHILHLGKNCLAVALGDGWWRGTTGGIYRNNFGYKTAYIGQIKLQYEDGSYEYIVSDESFLTATGGLLENDMKEGEVFDARLEREWKNTEYDDSSWNKVHIETDIFARKDMLVASEGVPVREKEVFEPNIKRMPGGDVVLDFGQNIAGYVKMCLRGLKAGEKVTLIHGEALDENGNFTLKNLIIDKPKAKIQRIEYIARGDDEETYCPMFAIFGFQYVLISGYDGEIEPGDFQALALYSDMEESGRFNCSNPLINKLIDNSRWSQKGNFMDVPTDCPTRERSPWSGDSHIYAKTASRFMNVYGFFEKWMKDLSAEQFASGKVPNTIPLTAAIHNPQELKRRMQAIDAMPDEGMTKQIMKMTLGTPENGGLVDGSAGWGDTAVITPYIMYLCYGDKTILENQYESAKKWVEYMQKEAANASERYTDMPWYEEAEDAKYIWDTDFHFGEWLEPVEQGDNPTLELYQNPDYKTATMYYFHSADLLGQIAEILGKEEATVYKQLARRVKEVYNRYFISEDGTITEGRQAPHVRALAFGLADEEHQSAVAAKLISLVRENGYKLNTGFLATVHLLPVLVDCGYIEEAYRVLEQTECPGWLYNVKAGATTILETWDGFAKCAESFNHYSYGAVCDFLFEYTAGIRPLLDTPGYKKFVLHPVMGGSLKEAKAEYESNYGKIISAWKRMEQGVEYEFKIPVNTSAVIRIPAEKRQYQVVQKEYPQAVYEGGLIVLETGSGEVRFTI